MKKHLSIIGFIFICSCLAPAIGLACTTFVLDNGNSAFVGKNFDYYMGDGLLIVNKRGVAKTSIPFSQSEPDAPQISWTSKYGSVTFTFFSREMPFAGMNEAGLVIEAMMLPETKMPEPDSRTPINGFQWMQYQLDNFSTVDEVIASDQILRIPQPENSYGRGHHLVRDSQGNCATIEWLDGKMVCHTGENLPYKLLTNSTYDKSLKYLSLYKGYGGILPISLSRVLIKLVVNPLRNSFPRFVCAADILQKDDSQTSVPVVDSAFDILSKVAQPSRSMGTKWSIVYDIAGRTVYFKTLGHDSLRYFNLLSFDFSCATPVKALDVNAELSGDVAASFVDYTEDMGRGLLKKGMPSLPEETANYFLTYPAQYTHCTE